MKIINLTFYFPQDCNGDGITNCDDFAMIHYHGAKGCERPIEGTKFYNRYLSCRPPSAEGNARLLKLHLFKRSQCSFN